MEADYWGAGEKKMHSARASSLDFSPTAGPGSGLCKEGTQTWGGRLAVDSTLGSGGSLTEESGCRPFPTSELLVLHTGGSQSFSGQRL